MPEYLAPGVYVEEVDTGSKPIEGVSTSTAGMVGMTRRGPIRGLPKLVTSFAEFRRKFGGYLNSDFGNHRYLAYAVEGFFQNGGKRVYIKRVPGRDTVAKPFVEAKNTVNGGVITRLISDSRDIDTDNDETNDASEVKLESLRGISTTATLNFIQIIDGVREEDLNVAVTSYDSDTKKAVVDLLTHKYQKKYAYVEVNDASISIPVTPEPTIEFKAKNEGSWGDDINIQVKHVSQGRTRAAKASSVNPADPAKTDIELNSISGFYEGAVVEIDNGTNREYCEISDIDGRIITIDDNAVTVAAGDRISTCEFSLVVSCKDEQETFDFLSMNNTLKNHFKTVINDKSELITADVPSSASSDTPPFNQPSAEDGLNIKLKGGGDGDIPGADAYSGVDNGPGQRTGIQALIDIDEVSIVAIPGVTYDDDQSVQNALINHCELLKDRFAVLDPPAGQNLEEVQDFRSNYDTKYAAIYYPLIEIRDRLTRKKINIPPSGHMIGIYARSDIERGVHKAPANEVIRGITGLEQTINKGEQDILNPKPNHINVLRDFRKSGRGYRVWGARCITSDPDWKYINVRRLFIFVEESIDEGTQWVVFEPNDEPTWARVRRSVHNFLTNVWRDGALQGATPEQAFFVRCDRTTMTQTDIDNGKLIMEIGIAPVKPAEFVIFRIGQWSGGSEVEEV